MPIIYLLKISFKISLSFLFIWELPRRLTTFNDSSAPPTTLPPLYTNKRAWVPVLAHTCTVNACSLGGEGDLKRAVTIATCLHSLYSNLITAICWLRLKIAMRFPLTYNPDESTCLHRLYSNLITAICWLKSAMKFPLKYNPDEAELTCAWGRQSGSRDVYVNLTPEAAEEEL